MSRPGLYQSSVKKLIQTKAKPESVIWAVRVSVAGSDGQVSVRHWVCDDALAGYAKIAGKQAHAIHMGKHLMTTCV